MDPTITEGCLYKTGMLYSFLDGLNLWKLGVIIFLSAHKYVLSCVTERLALKQMLKNACICINEI